MLTFWIKEGLRQLRLAVAWHQVVQALRQDCDLDNTTEALAERVVAEVLDPFLAWEWLPGLKQLLDKFPQELLRDACETQRAVVAVEGWFLHLLCRGINKQKDGKNGFPNREIQEALLKSADCLEKRQWKTPEKPNDEPLTHGFKTPSSEEWIRCWVSEAVALLAWGQIRLRLPKVADPLSQQCGELCRQIDDRNGSGGFLTFLTKWSSPLDFELLGEVRVLLGQCEAKLAENSPIRDSWPAELLQNLESEGNWLPSRIVLLQRDLQLVQEEWFARFLANLKTQLAEPQSSELPEKVTPKDLLRPPLTKNEWHKTRLMYFLIARAGQEVWQRDADGTQEERIWEILYGHSAAVLEPDLAKELLRLMIRRRYEKDFGNLRNLDKNWEDWKWWNDEASTVLETLAAVHFRKGTDEVHNGQSVRKWFERLYHRGHAKVPSDVQKAIRRLAARLYRRLSSLEIRLKPELNPVTLKTTQLLTIPDRQIARGVKRDMAPGQVICVETFAEGEEPPGLVVSFGNCEDPNLTHWLELPSPARIEVEGKASFQGLNEWYTMVWQRVRQAPRDPVPEEMLQKGKKIVTSWLHSPEGLTEFDALAHAAQNKKPVAKKWLTALTRDKWGDCYPATDDSGQLVWNNDCPEKENNLTFAFNKEMEIRKVLTVERFAPLPEEASCCVNLGDRGPIRPVQEAHKLREIVRSNKSMCRKITEPVYRLFGWTVNQILNGRALNEDQAADRAQAVAQALTDSTSEKSPPALEMLDQVLQQLHSWCNSLGLKLLPQEWRYEQKVKPSQSFDDLSKTCEVDFFESTVEGNGFIVKVVTFGFQGNKLRKARIALSIGSGPSELAELRQAVDKADELDNIENVRKSFRHWLGKKCQSEGNFAKEAARVYADMWGGDKGKGPFAEEGYNKIRSLMEKVLESLDLKPFSVDTMGDFEKYREREKAEGRIWVKSISTTAQEGKIAAVRPGLRKKWKDGSESPELPALVKRS